MVVLIGVIVAIMCVFLLRMYTLAAVSRMSALWRTQTP